MTDVGYVALDLETTGLNPVNDRIIEIGAALMVNGKSVQEFTCMVNPGIPIPLQITEITGISDAMVKQAGTVEEALARLMPLIKGRILLGHNILFDYSFLKKAYADQGIEFTAKGIDTYRLAKRFLPALPHKSLEALCEHFRIETAHHRALADAIAASDVYQEIRKLRNISDEEAADVEELTYRLPKREPATQKQIRFLKNLYIRCHIQETRPAEELSKSEASKEIDRILTDCKMVRSPRR